MKLRTLLLWACLSGCFKLDPFIYVPVRVDAYTLPAEGEVPEETVAPGSIEALSIKVDDEVTLGAALVKAQVQPALGQVLFFHGQGGNVDTHLWRAKRWANMGFDTLIFDYRSWGISTPTTPTEEGLLEDAAAARAWLVNRFGGDQKLVYYGNSFGTAVATPFAVQSPPRALVLEAGFASIEDFKTDSSQMDFPVSFVGKAAWATSTHIKNVTAPVFVLHGLADDYVRPEFSEKIYANANEPKKLLLVEGAQHSGIPEVLGAEYQNQLLSFVLTYLP